MTHLYSQTISNWASQCKMKFDPDAKKQVQGVYFSKKANNVSSLPVTFNDTNVVTRSFQKNLRVVPDN